MIITTHICTIDNDNISLFQSLNHITLWTHTPFLDAFVSPFLCTFFSFISEHWEYCCSACSLACDFQNLCISEESQEWRDHVILSVSFFSKKHTDSDSYTGSSNWYAPTTIKVAPWLELIYHFWSGPFSLVAFSSAQSWCLMVVYIFISLVRNPMKHCSRAFCPLKALLVAFTCWCCLPKSVLIMFVVVVVIFLYFWACGPWCVQR